MESVQRFTVFAIIPLIFLVMMAIPDGIDAAWESIILPSGKVVHLGDAAGVSQELGKPGTLRQVNVVFILDASGSMTAELTGAGKSRLEVAKEAMAELLPQIPDGVRCALWFYGHRYPQKPKEKSCADIEEAFSLGPIDVADYLAKINAIDAIGYTPIAGSIELAAKELPTDEFNSIVLLSDGEETCGGDPCALAEALKASDAAVSIHVVGYAVEEKAREQLQCIARASGGTYHDAQDAADLLQALQEALAATIAETILRVEVVGPDGVTERADIHLYERNTENKVSSFIAHKDNAVPPGTYDLIVGTLPWIIYQNLVLPQGSTTVVRMELGAIRLLTPEREKASGHLYDVPTEERLGYYGGTNMVSPGSYRVVVNNSASEEIVVDPGETVEVVLGSIRLLASDGKEASGTIFDASERRLGHYSGAVSVVPGGYRVVVNNSTSEEIVVDSGEMVDVMFGAIQLTAPDGRDASGTFLAISGERLGHYGGTVNLLPGSYRVVVNGSTSEVMEVSFGETVRLLLGAISLKGGFEISDVSGKRLGWYRDLVTLVPGTYTVKPDEGPGLENIVVQAGEVTVLK